MYVGVMRFLSTLYTRCVLYLQWNAYPKDDGWTLSGGPAGASLYLSSQQRWAGWVLAAFQERGGNVTKSCFSRTTFQLGKDRSCISGREDFMPGARSCRGQCF